MLKKMFAFTLTEIMVAVGIIGIVSALTVPTLVNNYQKRANVVQLRKVLNDISAAADMYITENEKQSLNQVAAQKGSLGAFMDDFISEKLNVTRHCEDVYNLDGCFAANYSSLDGSESKPIFRLELGDPNSPVQHANDIQQRLQDNSSCWLLANSAAICGRAPEVLARVDRFGQFVFSFIIDVNGPEGPNIGGRDIFNVILDSSTLQFRDEGAAETCGTRAVGTGCYQRLIDNNWQMDY